MRFKLSTSFSVTDCKEAGSGNTYRTGITLKTTTRDYFIQFTVMFWASPRLSFKKTSIGKCNECKQHFLTIGWFILSWGVYNKNLCD